MVVNTIRSAKESTKSGLKVSRHQTMQISAAGVVNFILGHKWLHFTLYLVAIAWFYLVAVTLRKWGLQ